MDISFGNLNKDEFKIASIEYNGANWIEAKICFLVYLFMKYVSWFSQRTYKCHKCKRKLNFVRVCDAQIYFSYLWTDLVSIKQVCIVNNKRSQNWLFQKLTYLTCHCILACNNVTISYFFITEYVIKRAWPTLL